MNRTVFGILLIIGGMIEHSLCWSIFGLYLINRDRPEPGRITFKN